MRLRDASLRRVTGACIALLAGLLGTLPLLVHGPSCGHDFDFHLQSWLAVRGAWASGLPVPHWVPGANYGAGEPRFVFYPPLSWLLGAVLSFALPWGLVPAAFTAMCLGGAATSMYSLASRFVEPRAASLAALLYGLSPYLLFTGYERTAYGELLAAVWMPLLVAASLRAPLPVVRTGLLLAALWYSNAPAAVMGCYLVALRVLWGLCIAGGKSAGPVHSSVWREGATVMARGVAALALGGALAADYLLPAWFEQRFVAIERAVGPGMRVEDSILFGRTGEPFHDQVLRTASWIAVVTLGAGALSAGGLLWRWRKPAASGHAGTLAGECGQALPGAATGAATTRRLAGFLGLLVAVCFLLQLRWSLPVWRVLPELAFLQFPWRLLLVGSIAAALLAVLGLPPLRGRAGRAAVLGIAVLYGAGAVGWAAHTRYQPCDEEDNVAAQRALPGSGGGFEGTDEYAAKGSDNGEIQTGLPPVRLLRSPDADEGDDSREANPVWQRQPGELVRGAVQIRFWGPESLLVKLRPEREAYAVLRLQRFPGWRVLLDGRPCGNACVLRDDGLATVHLSPGRWSTIEAQENATGDVWWGRAISAGGLLLLLGWRAGAVRRKSWAVFKHFEAARKRGKQIPGLCLGWQLVEADGLTTLPGAGRWFWRTASERSVMRARL